MKKNEFFDKDVTYNVCIIVKRKGILEGNKFWYDRKTGEALFDSALLIMKNPSSVISFPYDINGNSAVFCIEDVSAILFENPNIRRKMAHEQKDGIERRDGDDKAHGCSNIPG